MRLLVKGQGRKTTFCTHKSLVYESIAAKSEEDYRLRKIPSTLFNHFSFDQESKYSVLRAFCEILITCCFDRFDDIFFRDLNKN